MVEGDEARARSVSAGVAEWRAAVERARSEEAPLTRAEPALDGRDVMKILGCAPGQAVGDALAHLTECVLENQQDT